jgi:hypothetical protein
MSQHESLARARAAGPFMLPATLRLDAVNLTDSNLGRSVAFYEDTIGLRLHRRKDGVAAMGTGEEDLLVLYEESTAQRAGRLAGLYTTRCCSPPVSRWPGRRCDSRQRIPASRAPQTTVPTRHPASPPSAYYSCPIKSRTFWNGATQTDGATKRAPSVFGL